MKQINLIKKCATVLCVVCWVTFPVFIYCIWIADSLLNIILHAISAFIIAFIGNDMLKIAFQFPEIETASVQSDHECKSDCYYCGCHCCQNK